jgi:hypothetical protein
MMSLTADVVQYFSKNPRRMNHQLRFGEAQRFFLALPAGFDASRAREVSRPSEHLRFAQQSISAQLHPLQALSRECQELEWRSLAPHFLLTPQPQARRCPALAWRSCQKSIRTIAHLR